MTFTAFLLCAIVWLLSIYVVVCLVMHYIKKHSFPQAVESRHDDELYPFWWE